MGLVSVFITAFVLTAAYHRIKQRSWGASLQRAFAVAVVAMVSVFILAILLTGFGIVPGAPPEAAS
ncbi:MAG: hypothetical protein AAGF51_12745 [Pseudomonadota bacterium]